MLAFIHFTLSGELSLELLLTKAERLKSDNCCLDFQFSSRCCIVVFVFEFGSIIDHIGA